MAPPAAAAATLFAEKEKFICVDPAYPTTPYEAEVVRIEPIQGVPNYRIHYKGWNDRCDVWMPVGEEDGVMFKGLNKAEVQAFVNERAEREGIVIPKSKAKAKKPSTPAPAAPSTSTPKAAASKAAASKATPKTPATPKAKAIAKAQSKTVGKSTPKPVTPKVKTPAAKTPTAKKTPAKPTPKAKTPAAKTRAPPTRRAESEHSEELGAPSDSEGDEEMEVEVPQPQPAPQEPQAAEPAAAEPQAVETDDDEVEVEPEEADDESVEEITIELPTRHVDADDVILHIPANIRQNLIDDCSMVRIGYLANVPARYTIEDIVKIYERHICPGGYNEADWDDLIIDCKENWSEDQKFPEALYILSARSFTDYFNGTCGAQLYRPERKQLRELIRTACKGADVPDHRLREAGFRPSDYYGIQHLVRVIATIPDHIAQQDWNDHMLNTLLHGMTSFVKWLDENLDRFFNKDDYHVPTLAERHAAEYEASVQEN